MQTRHGKDYSQENDRVDWSNAFYSLDDIYYFGGQNDHNQIAICKFCCFTFGFKLTLILSQFVN